TYRVESNAFLVRLGSHSELFCKSPITLKKNATIAVNSKPL
ncbi:type II toxin-antitoxin system YafQ family toxin, partial [Helicobacter pylori]|nr:type II toxin-antitoxin system YafQ family toxin [Helicobacter pylori]